MQRIILIVGLLLIGATIGKWAFDSKDYGEWLVYSRDSKIITTKEVDPLFGTSIEKSEHQPGSWMGLLDIAFPFGALPICGVLGAATFGGMLLLKRRKKK